MKTKQIPLIVMLLAGAVASICARLMHYELETTLWILLLVLIVFYIVGCFAKKTIDSFEAAIAAAAKELEKQEEEAKASEEGEMAVGETPESSLETESAQA